MCHKKNLTLKEKQDIVKTSGDENAKLEIVEKFNRDHKKRIWKCLQEQEKKMAAGTQQKKIWEKNERGINKKCVLRSKKIFGEVDVVKANRGKR